MDVDNARFTANRKAFGLTYAGKAGGRFVDADLETFPAGGYVRAAKDPAARAAGVQHVALWLSAAKGGEICFTARGMRHAAAAHRRRPKLVFDDQWLSPPSARPPHRRWS